MEYLKAFETIVKEQLERVERMKNAPQSTDYKSLDKIIVGIIDGDGIGPYHHSVMQKDPRTSSR